MGKWRCKKNEGGDYFMSIRIIDEERRRETWTNKGE